MKIDVIEQTFKGCKICSENFKEENIVRASCPTEKAANDAISSKLKEAEKNGMEIYGLCCVDRANDIAYAYHISRENEEIYLW